jgi:predicted metalloprotease with PDZ domain
MKIHISYSNPISHVLSIQLTFEEHIPTQLQLPAWRPGRYELQDFAQNITNLNFSDGNEEVFFKRKTKDLWVTEESPNKLVVTYDYYAKQMDAGGSWLDDQQLYINFVTCILEPIDLNHDPEHDNIEVELSVPEDYIFATSLKQKGRFLWAKDYFELVDSPVISSANIKHHQYEQRRCNFHLWIQGNCEPKWEELEADFRKYGEEQISLFGEFPCDNYHYLFQVLPYKHYHGVEHSNSTVITLGPGSDFNTPDLQSNLLGISSHELFHTWNVCRIKPEEFLPHYDYSKENYYETGYITEGVTTYYGDYMLGRSGVFNTEEYFKEINLYLKRHFENEGRLTTSLTDSSFKLWLDGYKIGVPAAKSSIYIKGALAALILDLEIRKATSDDNCLDDVMRELWRVCGEKKHGYNHDFYEAIVQKITQQDFTWYFNEVIFGTKDLYSLLNNALSHVGCRVTISPNLLSLERQFGFRTVEKGERLKVVKIAGFSSASKCLDLGDEIISINNIPPVAYKGDASEVLLEVFRLGEIYHLTLSATEDDFLNIYQIEKESNASTVQRNSFELWLKKKF